MAGLCVLVLFVDTTPDQQRRIEVLSQLEEIGLALALSLKAKAEAASTLEEAQALALAFHRVSRSVRLSVALELRLERDVRDHAAEDRRLNLRAADTRKAQVRKAIAREAYAEYEPDDAEALLDELEDRLEEEALYETFPQGAIEACLSRIRKDLGLPDPPANDQGQHPAPFPLEGGRTGDGGARAAAGP